MNPSTTDGGRTINAVAKATLETAPPAGLALWHTLLDLPIEKWLTSFAIIYTALQIVVLIRKEFLKRQEASQ